MILPLRHRAAFAKFHCGIAPLSLYEQKLAGLKINLQMNVNVFFCNVIESESHALLDYILYTDLRSELFSKAQALNEVFMSLSTDHKLIFLFSNHGTMRQCAKTCFNILQRRAFYLCK